ncbi:MAG: DUF3649 domain-containing protein [Verrucomicrobiota bacterium]
MPAVSPHPTPRRAPTARYRLAVASRTIAALGGGYAMTALLSLAIALLDRAAPRDEAIAAGNVPAFLAFAACIVWAFVASTATRAWLGIGLPAAALGLLVWGLLA